MEDEQIMAIFDWPEFYSICDIQVFLRFSNFYQQFIQEFNKVGIPLTSILKTTLAKSVSKNRE